jgi:hypothetical protein
VQQQLLNLDDNNEEEASDADEDSNDGIKKSIMTME